METKSLFGQEDRYTHYGSSLNGEAYALLMPFVEKWAIEYGFSVREISYIIQEAVGDVALKVIMEKQFKTAAEKTAKQDFLLKNNLIAYIDERRADGQEIATLLKSLYPRPYSIVPMSGYPEVTLGVARYSGIAEITVLVQELKNLQPGT